MILRHEGHEVLAESSAPAALAAADRTRLDFLVTDWLLQDDIDGLEVARRLAAANPRLRVIVVSGLPVSEAQAHLRDLQVEAVLGKPIDVQALISLINGNSATGAART